MVKKNHQVTLFGLDQQEKLLYQLLPISIVTKARMGKMTCLRLSWRKASKTFLKFLKKFSVIALVEVNQYHCKCADGSQSHTSFPRIHSYLNSNFGVTKLRGMDHFRE